MSMWICKCPMPSWTFIVICIYDYLQETVTVYVRKYLYIYLSENMREPIVTKSCLTFYVQFFTPLLQAKIMSLYKNLISTLSACIILPQYLLIRTNRLIYNGYLPNSLYTPALLGDDFTFKTMLQRFRWIRSIL